MKKLSISALIIASIVSCAENPKPKQQSATEVEQSAILTKSIAAASQTIDMIELFTSEIDAYKENDIIPAVSGIRIEKIHVDLGDKLKKGDLIATLDPTQYNQQMLNVNNLQSDYDRLKPVYEAGGISRQSLDQAKTALDVQREVAENIKKNIILTSPIDGVVTARNTEDGNLVNGAPIIHIAQMDRVKVMVNIPEQYVPVVKQGMAVEILSQVYPDEVFAGKVSRVAPALDSATHTFEVEITAPNSALKLRPGMYARARFNMGAKDAILVPDVAVQKQFGSAEHFVYILNGDKAERRIVTTGRIVGSSIDILSGVEVGEEVLTTAFSRLSDGAKVSVKR